MKRKGKKSGLTLVELLTVLAIISLLVGILIPAVSAVKSAALRVKQQGQFASIELGLTTFKNDYGDYPPSDWPIGSDYCGAQKLSEALLGLDLLGFHLKSSFTSNGTNAAGVYVYDVGDPVLFGDREKRSLELGIANAFRLRDLFPRTGSAPLEGDNFVLCDVFKATKVVLTPPGGGPAKVEKAGAPILYYKADTTGKETREIYSHDDNVALVFLKDTADGPGTETDHPLGFPGGGYTFFYDYITDPKITAKPSPYKSESYILISAGPDGLYGTGDDIRSFDN